MASCYPEHDFGEQEVDYNFTEEEIERAFNEEFGTDEFWTEESSVPMLQCILDTKFSSEPGMDYEADCQIFATPRLVVFCLLCPNVELKSYHHFISHHKGKSHAKNCAANLTSPPPQEPEDLIPMIIWRELKDTPKKFPAGSLEAQVVKNKKPILGMFFIFKEMISRKMKFSCDMCKVERIDQEEMLAHLTSTAHNKRYLNCIKKQHPTATEALSVMEKVEEQEGRIHHIIRDLSKQLPMSIQFGVPAMHSSTMSLASSTYLSETANDEDTESVASTELSFEEQEDLEGTTGESKICSMQELVEDAETIKKFYQEEDITDLCKYMSRIIKHLKTIKEDEPVG